MVFKFRVDKLVAYQKKLWIIISGSLILQWQHSFILRVICCYRQLATFVGQLEQCPLLHSPLHTHPLLLHHSIHVTCYSPLLYYDPYPEHVHPLALINLGSSQLFLSGFELLSSFRAFVATLCSSIVLRFEIDLLIIQLICFAAIHLYSMVGVLLLHH